MRLIQTKVRCVEGVSDSGWFVPGRETTLLYGGAGSGVSQLLHALESLNPLYDPSERKVFANHPEFWRQGNYRKRVRPEKKTAVVMVFSAEPLLVRELDAIDPALIETDRIEVGRRLDYSRWITFVEISASTRWSEIASDMKNLAPAMGRVSDSVHRDYLHAQWQVLMALALTDRVKFEIASRCRDWLGGLRDQFNQEELALAAVIQFKVERADRFDRARAQVAGWLPPVIRLGTGDVLLPSSQWGVQMRSIEGSALFLLLTRLRQVWPGIYSAGLENRLQQKERKFSDLLPKGVALPRLLVGETYPELHNVAESQFANRAQLVVLLSLLTELCYGHSPLFMLDFFIDDLDEDVYEMVSWLQNYGSAFQLFLSSARADIAEAKGWQTVLTPGDGGLVESGLKSY